MEIEGTHGDLPRKGRVLSETIRQWKMPDEATIRARQRRACLNQMILVSAAASLFCCFISVLLGVPQSFLGQWWMKPPRYPGAVEVKFTEGEVCQMPSPGIYCYEWYYRTGDSVEEVIAYYEDMEWAFHPRITFEWKRGRRFGLNWVAESCVRIMSNISCYQIIVHPSPDGDTEVYILERGAMGEIRKSDQ
jgi:hypothetical protein